MSRLDRFSSGKTKGNSAGSCKREFEPKLVNRRPKTVYQFYGNRAAAGALTGRKVICESRNTQSPYELRWPTSGPVALG
jgi:hypothetical protein